MSETILMGTSQLLLLYIDFCFLLGVAFILSTVAVRIIALFNKCHKDVHRERYDD
jgi:hypothetical protein